MSHTRFIAVLALVAGAGCFGGNKGDDDDNQPPPTTDPPTTTPPVIDPPPAAPAVYKRGSMSPIYQLTPREEYTRFLEGGITMNDADFTSNATSTSASAKMDQIANQIKTERGLASLDLLAQNRGDDRRRAQLIPFRGNPSDIDLFIDKTKNIRKAYIPLGGDLMTVGNEVSVIDLNLNPPREITRIPVGIHPQRIAVHPAGLIFVCNQFSNYITVIDPISDRPLQGPNGPIEIKTEYYCTDLLFVPRSTAAQDVDEQDLYVANGWRGSVLKYGLTVVRQGVSNQPVDVVVTDPSKPVPESQPAAEITGVGPNPYRLSLSEDSRSIFVTNNRGGTVGKIDIASRGTRQLTFNAPVPDVAQAHDILVLATTTVDRGLPFRDEPRSALIDAPAVKMAGIDGNQHVVHPGALYDGTRAYNFEDLRNGMFTADAQLTTGSAPVYYTDDVSGEPNFLAQQKVLKGSLPQAVVVNKNKDRAFVAMSGSDVVQQFSIAAGGTFRLADAGTFATAHRPFALALDEDAKELLVANWGSESLQIFDLTSRAVKFTVKTGYADPPYPATNMEKGEFLYYNTSWSNTGRKSCATCHFDELLADGVGYANGATAPTAYHQVPPNWNLLTTDSYFWNGSFENGTYTSLAADAQTRTNCELILFGLTEGVSSDPNTRVGDNANRVRSDQDTQCRPQSVAGKILPTNFDAIAQIIAAQHLVRDTVVQAAVGVDFATAARVVDFYSVSEMRLPPNPTAFLAANNELDSKTAAQITQGKALFQSAGCANCHDPNNTRHPFTDGQNHGQGVEWTNQFVDFYQADKRVTDLLGAFNNALPGVLLDGRSPGVKGPEINVHLDPIDYFEPFCFNLNTNNCLVFEDPLLVRNTATETDRLEALTKVNLGNKDRGFFPGNIRGQPQSNTPSIRGNWWQTNFLRHGHAHSLKEAVLGPGHPLLGPNENGYAIDMFGKLDVHGATSKMQAADFDALTAYVLSIE